MFIYIVEQRTIDEDTNLGFVGSSVEKCVQFMLNNKDFDKRDKDWWWAITVEILDNDMFNDNHPDLNKTGMIHAYDWDGNLLSGQPVNGYRNHKIDSAMRSDG